MERTPIRELNQQTSRVLARVWAGESLEITDHGEAVARLIPIRPGASVLDRLVREGSATPLQSFLDDNPRNATTSPTLIEVELPRALPRSAPYALPRVERFQQRLYRLDIDRQVRRVAADFDDPTLRSLDAIHLATALLLKQASSHELDHFVAYDNRLVAVAAAHGLPIASPA
jgi:hypothetical protein